VPSAPYQLVVDRPFRRLHQLLTTAVPRTSIARAIGRSRTLRVMAAYLALGAVANYLAFLLRFDGSVPPLERRIGVQALPWLLVTNAVVFVPFRLYRGLWRFSGIWDVSELAAAVTISSFLFYVLVHQGLGLHDYPRSVFILTALLSIALIGGAWLVRRLAAELGCRRRGKRIVIYGAGDGGGMVINELLTNSAGARIVGFIDDDPRKAGIRVMGYSVLGGYSALLVLIKAGSVDAIVISFRSMPPERLNNLQLQCADAGIGLTRLRVDLEELVDVESGAVKPLPSVIRHIRS
jgi:FlaA1/EpsC-like NDP-sugar epimerase